MNKKEKKEPKQDITKKENKKPDNGSLIPQYNFKEIEKKWLEFWQSNNIYKFDPKDSGEIFSIDTPPPTVSGVMHLWHAASYSHHDFIARFKRMQGFNVFFPWGFDDNGLPTERYVENKTGKKAQDMSRIEFIDLCLQETKEVEEQLKKQWMSIGYSADFSIYYQTINEISRKLSQKSFIDLYEDGRAYRKEGPVLWCPECKTAIAQVELKDKEQSTLFNDITFQLKDEKKGTCGEITISTTRPEFLPACVAIFYNPQDNRYKSFKHKRAIVPLFEFDVPIMEDERVDINKGTGLVMCCTFGDQTDMECWKAYGLPYKKLLTSEGKLNDTAGKYAGLTIKDARDKIIKDLKEKKIITKQQKIKHMVNVHERCNTEVEFLIEKQWYIRYLDLKEKFLKIGKEINWHPEFMKSRYDNWINGLQWDWCISRQRHFGVPFPVWYCKQCDEIILAKEKNLPVDPFTYLPPVKQCPKCKSKEFIPEEDVIDTWATSSLSPDIAIETAESLLKTSLKKIYPFSLRPQAHDIITFWAFNTIVKAHFHHNSKPWNDIMISGYVLFGKEKMSKSKGNSIEPEKILEKYGVDCLRYWTSTSKLGEDITLDEKELVAAERLIKKIWNAYNFIKMHLPHDLSTPKKVEEIDSFLLLKLEELVRDVTGHLENYEYSHARALTEKFFWQTFCDNYLEIIKKRIYGENIDKKKSAQHVLGKSLLTILKLFAPIMPCITEEIYQEFFKDKEKSESIHVSKWPETNFKKFTKQQEELDKKGTKFFEILGKVRQEKSKAQKSMKSEINLTIKKEDKLFLKNMLEDLKAVTNSKEIKEGEFKVEFL